MTYDPERSSALTGVQAVAVAGPRGRPRAFARGSGPPLSWRRPKTRSSRATNPRQSTSSRPRRAIIWRLCDVAAAFLCGHDVRRCGCETLVIPPSAALGPCDRWPSDRARGGAGGGCDGKRFHGGDGGDGIHAGLHGLLPGPEANPARLPEVLPAGGFVHGEEHRERSRGSVHAG